MISFVKNFPCIACGLCCQNSYLVHELQALINKDGLCKNFDKKTKRCRIYQTRPLICNIDEMYKQQFYHQMTKKEFYLANLEVCYKLNFIADNKDNLKKIQSIIEEINKIE